MAGKGEGHLSRRGVENGAADERMHRDSTIVRLSIPIFLWSTTCLGQPRALAQATLAGAASIVLGFESAHSKAGTRSQEGSLRAACDFEFLAASQPRELDTVSQFSGWDTTVGRDW